MSKSNSLKKRIFAAILAGTVLMSLSLTGCNNNGKTDESSKTSTSSTVSEVSQAVVESKFGDSIVIKTENYQVPLPIVTYFFNYYYRNYVNTYGTYMSYYGFDQSVDLKEQYYDEENNITWYDFFMNQTRNYVTQAVVLAEGAKADGMELDEDELKSIEDNMNSFAEAASSNSLSEEEYIEKYYGEGVTKAYVEDFLKITTLAQKYYNKIYDSYEYTDTEYENYYSENKTSYQYADFLVYVFNADYDTDATDEEKKAANEEAKAYADALSKCKTEDEFKKYIKKYLEQHPEIITKTSTATSESSAEESTMTDEEIAEAINEKVEAVLNKKYSYEVSSDVGKWVFDGSREALDTTVVEGTDSYTAVMMIKPAYRDESICKNVRHILIKNTSYETSDNEEEEAKAKEQADKEAKAKAEEIYQEWKNGEATEDSFAELANKYSEDTGSNTTGGLYENVYENEMVAEFNDWCFDAKRKVGDTGIVETTYGYHIMYFSGSTQAAWKVNVDAALRSSDFNEHYKSLEEKYNVECDEDYLYTVGLMSLSSTSSEETSSES